MKKTILCAAVMAAFGLATLATQRASAADGKLTFIGSVYNTTCSVTGSGNATGKGDITIRLPAVDAAELSTKGKTWGEAKFSLKVGLAQDNKTCPDGRLAALSIDSDGHVDTVTESVRNQSGPGFAKNVNVQLFNGDNGKIIAFGKSASQPIAVGTMQGSNQPVAKVVDGTATLNYIAKYLADGEATAGDVNTSLNYTVIYN